MPYTTYNQFRTAVQLMLDGDEVASVIQPQTIDTLIGLGEGMIYLGSDVLPPLRASTMQAEFADVESDGNEVADNAVELPEDFLELVIAYFDPEKPLEVLSEPTYVAQAGESLIFAGAAADGDALLGRYYARPAPLKTALNATFHRYDELFLYAALVCAAPFMGQSAKIPVWRSYYSALLNQANHTERMRAYAGSRLRVRAR
jgi:hypothetical protein